MKTIRATDAKQKFGELIDMAQRGPVTVTSHGRNVAVVISATDYEAEQARKTALFDAKIARARLELKQEQGAPMEEFFSRRRSRMDKPAE